MNIFDITIILFIFLFGVDGFKKGIIKEGVSFLGILIIFFVSYTFKGLVGDLLCKWFPFFTFSGSLKGLVSLNILIYQLAGFFVLFFVLAGLFHIVFSTSNFLQKIVNATIILVPISAIGGFIIGLIRGFLVALLILLALLIPCHQFNMFMDSNVANTILYKIPVLSDYVGNISKSLVEVTDLVTDIKDKKMTTNEANLQLIDHMIKYDVVDVKTVKEIYNTNKLDDIEGIEEYLENYK